MASTSSNVPAAAERKPPANHGKLFVGGVPVGTTEDVLREHFARFGRVAVVGVPKHKKTGNPRGFAFVQFARHEDAERALAAGRQGHVINGRMLDVKVAKRAELKGEEHHSGDQASQNQLPSRDHSSQKKIFVGGLHPTVDNRQLGDYFKNFGAISRAVVITDINTKLSRGFGYVEFAEEESANRVMEDDRHYLGGAWAEVKHAIPKGGNSEQGTTASNGLSARAPPYYPARFTNNGRLMVPASLCFVNINATYPTIGFACPGFVTESWAGDFAYQQSAHWDSGSRQSEASLVCELTSHLDSKGTA